MEKKIDFKDVKTARLLEVLGFYQGVILDTLELELIDHKAWRQIRSRVLKALGDRGMAKKIVDIMEGQ